MEKNYRDWLKSGKKYINSKYTDPTNPDQITSHGLQRLNTERTFEKVANDVLKGKIKLKL